MKKLFVIPLFVSMILPLSSLNAQTSGAYLFKTSLKLGDTSRDVLFLQQFLNLDPATRISTSGIGSSGQETNYFGLKTQQAVKKFQQKYASEVLTPGGLSQPTGFVGSFTLKKINELNGNASKIPEKPLVMAPTTVSVQTNTTNPTVTSSQPLMLYTAVPREVRPGDTITLYGQGFTSGMVVSIAGTNAESINVANTSLLTARVPGTMPSGTYTISISRSGTAMTPQRIPTTLVVSPNPRPQPKITSITPQTVKESDTITITGSGFTQDNTITTMLGNLERVSSADGKTLTFKPSQLPQISFAAEMRQRIKEYEAANPQQNNLQALTSYSNSSVSSNIPVSEKIMVTVSVINETGFTSDNAYFILQ